MKMTQQKQVDLQKGAIFTLKIWEVFLFKLSFTVSFKLQSLSIEVTVKSLQKKELIPL